MCPGGSSSSSRGQSSHFFAPHHVPELFVMTVCVPPEAEFLDVIGNCPPCYSQSPLLTDFTPPSPLSKSALKLVCNVNIVYENHKSENSQDYAQKPHRNCMFMNLASVVFTCIIPERGRGQRLPRDKETRQRQRVNRKNQSERKITRKNNQRRIPAGIRSKSMTCRRKFRE